MGKWLDKARTVKADPRVDSVFSAVSPPAGPQADPNDTKDTNGTLRRSPDASTREWRANLARLSWDKPLHGLEVGRWRGLLGDAHWLLDHFGMQAARDGWSAADLFGVCGVEGFGGVAERLRSSRSLVMGADLATWRRVVNGTPESFARGIGKQAGFTLLWEGSQ